MLKGINLQLFSEESAGVNESVAAEQNDIMLEEENTTQEIQENQQSQENTGVENQPAAEANEGVEKAFAARLAKERERLEAEYRQRHETELKSHPTLSYLEQKAQALGMTVEQLIENDRKFEEQQKLNELVQQNIPEQYAKEMLENRKFREQYQSEKQTIEQKEKEQKMYAEFLEAYPDIDAKDVPVEVWQEVKEGRNLLDAYVRYENKRLKDEMAKYQQQQQTAEANEKNASSSTGSVKNTEKQLNQDPFLAGFDSVR